MDLRTVLADGSDGLGSAALARYYNGIFSRYLPQPDDVGAFRVRAALHFGVQQLATRSRVSPDTERYLQVGGFSANDLPAALIEAMPHTIVVCRDAPVGTAEAVTRLRRLLPEDAMPRLIDLEDTPLPQGRFGLIAVFAENAPPDPAPWRRYLNPAGRLLLIHRPSAGETAIIDLCQVALP